MDHSFTLLGLPKEEPRAPLGFGTSCICARATSSRSYHHHHRLPSCLPFFFSRIQFRFLYKTCPRARPTIYLSNGNKDCPPPSSISALFCTAPSSCSFLCSTHNTHTHTSLLCDRKSDTTQITPSHPPTPRPRMCCARARVCESRSYCLQRSNRAWSTAIGPADEGAERAIVSTCCIAMRLA
ncbi:hypothetical protein IE81DRAFT_162172 [Ceraceosorus guamensis]|uniref:Uncharacterized protein n=1 Tax=Ceraceosorus guamensis TaxID=1522189 RepID=A0A316WDN1_9BASI|nr:hypothetical protein IE81DRAFT_162172 [Ceraceosorus guamensis]PWN45575.1 hypothetical protein IE81DRAFT_162172 [Ceraceosorus guamensis]